MTVIEAWCRHCGQQLAAEWGHNPGSISIDGARAVTVIHARTGETDCSVTRPVSFDIWQVNKALRRAEGEGDR